MSLRVCLKFFSTFYIRLCRSSGHHREELTSLSDCGAQTFVRDSMLVPTLLSDF